MGNISILHMGAWGFIITLSAFIFTYIGRQIDLLLNTEPHFMIGFLMLSVAMTIVRLYQDAMRKIKR